MKRILYYLFLFSLLPTCTSEPDNPDQMNLTIRLLGTPQCIYLKSPEAAAKTPDSQSCVEYAFDHDARRLILKHINAAFNCCPESLWCMVTYQNDTIIIQEFEKNMGCKCNCLYDLDIEIEGVEPGKYQIRLVEPYVGNQEKLNFELDIRTKKQGRFCVLRTIYPWSE